MRKILIVDDEPAIRKLYQKEFTEDGYNVMLAGSGDEALDKVGEDEKIDLVILDIKMEEKDGLEVLDVLRKKNRSLPVILNSAYSTYKNDFTSWLADAYLVKSHDLTELKDKVQELLLV
ncbi:MAG: response regulator [candidate division Zixibacteria bacterium]|nr:response regulator [candidate division Zixibacteria bacterium]